MMKMAGRNSKDVLEERLRSLEQEKGSILMEIAELKEAIEYADLEAKVKAFEEEVAALREQKRNMEEKIDALPSQKRGVAEASVKEKEKPFLEEIVQKVSQKPPLRFQFAT